MPVDYKSFIIQDPAEILHSKCKKVTDFKDAKEIASKLIEVTKVVDGHFKPWLGMAAPQVGYNKRVIILRKSYRNYQVMVNPEIVEQKFVIPVVTKCFSVNGIYIVKSPYWIKVQCQNLQGNYYTEVIKNGRAVTLQQEIDHINGILISDIGFRIL